MDQLGVRGTLLANIGSGCSNKTNTKYNKNLQTYGGVEMLHPNCFRAKDEEVIFCYTNKQLADLVAEDLRECGYVTECYIEGGLHTIHGWLVGEQTAKTY